MTRPAPPMRRLVLATVGVALLPCVVRAQPAERHRIAILAPGIARLWHRELGGVPTRAAHHRLCRSGHRNREPLGRGARGAASRVRRRTGAARPGSHRRRVERSGVDGEAGDLDDPNRRNSIQRSSRQWARGQLCAPRRQCHRAVHHAGGHGRERGGAAQDRGPWCRAHCRSGRP